MKYKILIVDDNYDLLAVTKIVIEKLGYYVKGISDSREIFQQIKVYIPDLILLDVMLKEKDGREICRAIKKDENLRKIPVILYSACLLTNLENEQTGADDFLSKPYDIFCLDQKIKNLIHNRSETKI